MRSFQNLTNPEDILGGVYTQKVAMHLAWLMHRHGFKPASILNMGVGSGHELGIWKWLFPSAMILAVDPKPLYSCHRRRDGKLKFVQAVVDDGSSSDSIFCRICCSLQCKDQAHHEAAKVWQSVKAVTIDELSKELEPPYLMWMDIDGSEVRALQGATQTLKKTGWLCIELVNWIPRHRRNILNVLKRHGFVLEVLFKNDGLFRNSKITSGHFVRRR